MYFVWMCLWCVFAVLLPLESHFSVRFLQYIQYIESGGMHA